MIADTQTLIEQAYSAFNKRDSDGVSTDDHQESGEVDRYTLVRELRLNRHPAVRVNLSFDGISTIFWPRILDVLSSYGSHASTSLWSAQNVITTFPDTGAFIVPNPRNARRESDFSGLVAITSK